MKNIAILVLSVLTLIGCNAQTDKNTENNKSEISKKKIEPKIDYKVNKEYDENGNLIKYDSLYTYYYSNIDKESLIRDSVFKKFNDHFYMSNSLMNDPIFKDFFNGNKTLEEDFFKEDFFRKDFKRNHKIMNEMMRKMDSIKNKFFIEQYPLKDKREQKK